MDVTGEFSRHTHQYQRDYIAHADTKAAVIGTVSVGFLAFLEAKGAVDLSGFQSSRLSDWLGVASACAFFLAALGSAGVLWPRLGIGKTPVPPGTATPGGGAIYWEEVRRHGSADAYAAHVARLATDQINREIATHIFVLAGINQKKYRALGWALRILIAAVALLCGYLLFREVPPKTSVSQPVAPAAPATPAPSAPVGGTPGTIPAGARGQAAGASGGAGSAHATAPGADRTGAAPKPGSPPP